MTSRGELLIAIAVALGGLAIALGARWYRRLDLAPRGLTAAMSSGAVTGAAAAALQPFAPRMVTDAIPLLLLLIASEWIRRRDTELDGSDAFLTGSIAGLAAAAITVPVSAQPLTEVARFGAAGPLAMGAAWFAATRRLPVAAWSAGAIGLGALATVVAGSRVGVPAAIAVALIPALVAVASVIYLRQAIAAELRAEAELGVFDAAEIASVAHPWRRLRFSTWPDRSARRRFVQLATEISLRKRQQRRMTPEAARLYQLEILKLRMELQSVERVHRTVLQRLASGPGNELELVESDSAIASDTMSNRR